MSGPPYNYADVTFGLQIQGGGRHDVYTLRPVNPANSAAWSPPLSLDVQSPFCRLTRSVSSSLTLTASTLPTYMPAPYTASYLAIVPPTNSAVSKTLKGVSGDAGIPLIPGLPLVLALPVPMPSSWQIYMAFGAAEIVEVLLW